MRAKEILKLFEVEVVLPSAHIPEEDAQYEYEMRIDDLISNWEDGSGMRSPMKSKEAYKTFLGMSDEDIFNYLTEYAESTTRDREDYEQQLRSDWRYHNGKGG